MLVARGICGNGRPFATAKRPSTECGPTIFAHPAPAFTNDDTGTSNSTYSDLRGACRTKARQSGGNATCVVPLKLSCTMPDRLMRAYSANDIHRPTLTHLIVVLIAMGSMRL
jgi:hypothetical protein